MAKSNKKRAIVYSNVKKNKKRAGALFLFNLKP